MNRFGGKTARWFLAAAALFCSALTFAELSATVDRREIAMGETLRLTLLGNAGEQPAEIDLTPLSSDWEILSRSSATNARFINGQNQVTRTLEMELAPLREGTLSIPPLTHGGRTTTPQSIRVNPEPTVAPGDALVLFEASVDKSSVYVQAETILTVTLQQAINLDGGEISNFDVTDAVIEDLERRSFQRRVGNRTWLVTELRYAIYPQKSGRLTIPAIGFNAREVQPGRSLLGARLGRRLRLASEPIELDIKPVPASFPGEVWLPARELALTGNWSIDPESLNIGDSTTRTLTLVARGLQGSQLPPLSSVQGSLNIPELRFYPDQESIDQSELSDGLQGQRIQSEALVARSNGSWQLPEIRVPWWNTETDSLQYAVLPARNISVATPASLEAAVPSLPDAELTGAPAAPPLWVWILSGSGWIVAVLLVGMMWMSRRQNPITSSTSATPNYDAGSLRQALVEVRRCAERNDLASLRRTILVWAHLHHGKHFTTFSDLATASSEALAKRLVTLDRCFYGGGDINSAMEGLIDALRDEPAPRAVSACADDLALYPN